MYNLTVQNRGLKHKPIALKLRRFTQEVGVMPVSLLAECRPIIENLRVAGRCLEGGVCTMPGQDC